MVRVRIAPSPTGFAHVGTAYTALFNYAFAKKNGGKFVLRLEDTDIKRNVEGAEKAIYEGLTWLGLTWDEGPDIGGKYAPYKQSERLETYKQYIERLLDSGMAYRDEGAVRFKNTNSEISWNDKVRGRISFPGEEIGDFVIFKSDGFPTYNFAVVIDDILMKITHVIRGEEHISNTPRQIAIYQALGEKMPFFAHLPTLRNKDKKKLSKRRDPVDLRIFRSHGYLPQALVNFLCLLGWSHPKEKEIFDLGEFVELFNLERVRKAGPIFDTEKLNWINGEYLRKIPKSKVKNQIFEFYKGKYPKELISRIIPLVQNRMRNLTEFESLAGFMFERKKPLRVTDSFEWHIKAAFDALSGIKKWERQAIDEGLINKVKSEGFKTGDFFMDLRASLSGSRVTPPINDCIYILGKDEVLERLSLSLK